MSTATKSCPLCGQQILVVATKCRHCRRYLDPQRRRQEEHVDGLLGNTPNCAIAAGYLGFFAFVPVLGFLSGLVAIALGAKTLRLRREDPSILGVGRAWFGIVASAVAILFWIAVFVWLARENTRY